MATLSKYQFGYAAGLIITPGGNWRRPPDFVFVRMPGYCTECGDPVRADSGYVLAGGGLGCASCGVLERQLGPAPSMRQKLDHIWAKAAPNDLLETIKRICTGGLR